MTRAKTSLAEKELLDSLSKDPEFFEFDEATQDAIFDEELQRITGVPTRNFLEKVVRRIGTAGPSAVMQPGIGTPQQLESVTEAVPSALQFGGGVTGSIVGSRVGRPFLGGALGEGAGRGIGEVIRQTGKPRLVKGLM